MHAAMPEFIVKIQVDHIVISQQEIYPGFKIIISKRRVENLIIPCPVTTDLEPVIINYIIIL